jgi:hypothetical protein
MQDFFFKEFNVEKTEKNEQIESIIREAQSCSLMVGGHSKYPSNFGFEKLLIETRNKN